MNDRRPPSNQPVSVAWESGAERLFNLVIALINYGPRSVSWILDNVEGYRPTQQGGDDQDQPHRDSVVQRLRRDRGVLLRAGIPITTSVVDSPEDPSQQETIWALDPADFELPDISFTPAEADVISAAGVWAYTHDMSRAAQSAYAKLSSLGIRRKTSGHVLTNAPDLTNLDEASLDAMFRGLSEGKTLEFFYYPSLVTTPVTRQLEPWAYGAINGKIYLTGYDASRGGQRTFRLSRIDSISLTDRPCQHPVPQGSPRSIIETGLAATGQRVVVTVEFPGPGAQELRALCTSDGTIGPVDRDWIVRTAASYAPDAIVTAPQDVVDDVVALLSIAAGQSVGHNTSSGALKDQTKDTHA